MLVAVLRKTAKLTVPVTAGILLLEFLASAWVSEDAHITFRAIVNFTNGDGPRWNLDERVQVFTHPLWMMLISLAYSVTREFYFTVTAISLALSVSAYVILARLWRELPLLVGNMNGLDYGCTCMTMRTRCARDLACIFSITRAR